MPESYSKIFPGNAVNHLNVYGLPNADFTTNARALGDPRDRKHQALLVTPGWMAVRKVAYALIPAAGGTVFPLVIGSHITRPGTDKSNSDITGLLVPSGSSIYRAAFRVLPSSSQPTAPSQGVATASTTSGITGTATNKLILATATPSASGAASIAAGAVTTGTDSTALIVAADGTLPVGTRTVQSAFGSPVVTNADLTFSLYCMNTGVTGAGANLVSQQAAGTYVVAEVCYYVPESVATLDDCHLPGVRYSGYN